MEIYNEKIRDLLAPSLLTLDQDSVSISQEHSQDGSFTYNNSSSGNNSSVLRVREHPVYGPYVENLSKVEVTSPLEALKLLHEGHRNRATRSGYWNAESSRSHAIVTLELTPLHTSPTFTSAISSNVSMIRQSINSSIINTSVSGAVDRDDLPFVRLQMVDLAGSEKSPGTGYGKDQLASITESPSRTKRNTAQPPSAAQLTEHSNQEKQEHKFIRRSLSTLGYIIKALGKGAAFKSLPYRDTVLTWLLRDSLNGNNHTTMLATISPSHSCYEETLSTLKYAERLCLIGNKSYQLGDLSLFGNTPLKSHHPNTQLQSHNAVESLLSTTNADEYAHIFQSLGANRPGTKAFRQLLKQTISDPQQRLARMFTDQQKSSARRDELDNNNIYTNNINNNNDSENAYNREATEKYQQLLQNQITELQLEVNSIRIERDSFAMELQSTRDLYSEQQRQLQYDPDNLATSNTTTGNSSPRAIDREINNLKEVIIRKDEWIERLKAECQEEVNARLLSERAAKDKVNDIYNSFETLQM